MRINRPRAGTRRALKRELDILTSQIVRLRDQRCITTGSTLNLTCSHFYSRRWESVRWDLMNVHAQTFQENSRHNEDRKPYEDFMLKQYGGEALSELNRRRLEGVKRTDSELKDLILEYKGVLEVLRSEA